MEEVILVDEKDSIIGYKLRSELTVNDRWRICGAVVIDGEGNTLITQRSKQKKTDPLKWGPAVAGTLSKGESYNECVAREAYEEIGIKDMEITEIYRGLIDASDGNKRYCVWYKIKVNRDIKLTLQAEEVASYKWVGINWLINDFLEHPDNYLTETKTWKMVLQHYI